MPGPLIVFIARSQNESHWSKLDPALALAARDGPIDKSHSAHAGFDPRKRRRNLTLSTLLPRNQHIGKLPIENRKCLKITLGMSARESCHRTCVGAQVAPCGMPNLFWPIEPFQAQP